MNTIANNLIPADDLNWCEQDQKYVVFSSEEMDGICKVCYESGIEELPDVMKVVRWAEHARIGNLLLKNLLKGQICLAGIGDDDEPLFTRRDY